MSVGFMRVSPYWQYVTVCRGRPDMKSIFRIPPRGFSMNHQVGDRAMIRL